MHAQTFNIYCDESCHMERSAASAMVLGCVWCPVDLLRKVSKQLREVKFEHGLASPQDYVPPNRPFEVKWSKVSESQADFYCAWVDVFFQLPLLGFRGILIPDKSGLRHDLFDQTHDDWYYKMMFLLIDRVVNPACQYRIYLDIKDTRSEEKRAHLEDVLRSSNRNDDLAGEVIERVQQIRSHESELMQLADLLMGAVAHKQRRDYGDLREGARNAGKSRVIEHIQHKSGKSLSRSTWQGERKFNLLRWEPKSGGMFPC